MSSIQGIHRSTLTVMNGRVADTGQYNVTAIRWPTVSANNGERVRFTAVSAQSVACQVHKRGHRDTHNKQLRVFCHKVHSMLFVSCGEGGGEIVFVERAQKQGSVSACLRTRCRGRGLYVGSRV